MMPAFLLLAIAFALIAAFAGIISFAARRQRTGLLKKRFELYAEGGGIRTESADEKKVDKDVRRNTQIVQWTLIVSIISAALSLLQLIAAFVGLMHH